MLQHVVNVPNLVKGRFNVLSIALACFVEIPFKSLVDCPDAMVLLLIIDVIDLSEIGKACFRCAPKSSANLILYAT